MDKVDRVINVVCYVGKIKRKDLLAKNRERFVIDNRRMAFVICRDVLEMGWTQIAQRFNLNHASIIHHYNKHNDLMEYDTYYKDRFDDILEVFKLQIDYVEPKELIREIVNIKKQRYLQSLRIKLKNNDN